MQPHALTPTADGPDASSRGAVRGLGVAKAFAATGGVALLLSAWAFGLPRLLNGWHLGLFGLVGAVASCRLLLPTLARRAFRPVRSPRLLPAYTVIVPLRDEAAMAAQIVRVLGALDYPRERLQILLVVEADDLETAQALHTVGLPRHMRLLLATPGRPATKPRACNLALAEATGDLVVIYDAEDEPEPGQLREAAARFAAAPSHRGCLQAPLRIHARPGALSRQFALEYAALFEVVLPALSALRLPFPLGGTSNHFRRAALQDVGGWDAYNVTEDADIGMRLASAGWSLGMLQTPTWEEAPDRLDAWLPQRTRWLKGYVQTWSVAMRRPFAGGPRGAAALQATLGLAVLSSLLHGPLMLLTAASLLLAALTLHLPAILLADLALMSFAYASALLLMQAGARRAGLAMGWRDALLAPPYWMMQSLAAAFALHQLVRQPFHWNKTPHRPHADPTPEHTTTLDDDQGSRIAKAA